MARLLASVLLVNLGADASYRLGQRESVHREAKHSRAASGYAMSHTMSA